MFQIGVTSLVFGENSLFNFNSLWLRRRRRKQSSERNRVLGELVMPGGHPGVSDLGSVGISFLVSYQGDKIAAWNFFFSAQGTHQGRGERRGRFVRPYTYKKNTWFTIFKKVN